MIRLICGPKGTGKTKIILDAVDASIAAAKGDIVFITDIKINTVRVNFNVRCLYCEEYGISTAEKFSGFIDGLLAGNSDIEYLFIDGLVRIIGSSDEDLKIFLEEIEKLEKAYGIKAVITVSKTVEQLPENFKQYAN